MGWSPHLLWARNSLSKFFVTPGPRSSSFTTTYWFVRVSVASCATMYEINWSKLGKVRAWTGYASMPPNDNNLRSRQRLPK